MVPREYPVTGFADLGCCKKRRFMRQLRTGADGGLNQTGGFCIWPRPGPRNVIPWRLLGGSGKRTNHLASREQPAHANRLHLRMLQVGNRSDLVAGQFLQARRE